MKKLTTICFIGLSLVLCVGCKPYFGDIEIYSNADIETFSEVGYTHVFGSVYIEETTLTSLEGMESLKWVTRDLVIQFNDSLTSLAGLENVTSVGGLGIGDNNSLTSITGLENITSVGGVLGIVDNNSLTSLTGLDNITSVGKYLVIWDNNSLTSLSGLESLNNVGDDVRINNNDSLTSLTGLNNLNSVDGDFKIYENIILPTSLAEDLKDQVLAGGGIGGEIRICGNLGGDPCP